ncbi:MAG: prepilin-type N-terminal cleavage/methylation domain-containing protein [Alphaproteobacteria bacterium]|nr:prepilin-type N-terminal cleavage/methylation domain-containing protein [Alphaproteobacteria bacterium]
MRGFSLVELSIVLVILGLLTGGILAGRSLIRAAELRSMPTEVHKYNAAMMAFRDKYFALPGDMRNAVRFWGAQAGGAADGTDAACQALDFSSPATTQATCNGNGDGMIGWLESWRAWQQLANAGLIEGTYTGVPGLLADTTWGTPGLNIPRSKVDPNGGYTYTWQGSVAVGNPSLFAGNYGNMLRYGGQNGVDQAGYLLAQEAWNIDTKMDDGKPSTGNMRGPKNASRPNCVSTDVETTAEYQLTTTIKQCNLFFISGF